MLGVWRLQLLRELERRGTLKEVAAAMSISPPAVSQQLALLEQEAGIELLERHGRHVRLTDAGLALARHADAITGALAAAEADMAGRRGSVSGVLRIAAFATAARAIVPAVVATLAHRYPALRVTVRDLEGEESLHALEADEIDIAIVDEYDEQISAMHPLLETIYLANDPLFLVTARPLPPGPVSLAAARGEAWVMDSERTPFFGAVLRRCHADGFDPQIRSNCKDFSVILALIEAGLGVGVVPGLALADEAPPLAIRRLKPDLSRRILAAVRSERLTHPAISAAVRELVDFGAAYSPQMQLPDVAPDPRAHIIGAP